MIKYHLALKSDRVNLTITGSGSTTQAEMKEALLAAVCLCPWPHLPLRYKMRRA